MVCLVHSLPGVKEIDIAATLEHIRDQRPGLVRTKVPSLPRSCPFAAFQRRTSIWLFCCVLFPHPHPAAPPFPLSEPGPVWVRIDGGSRGGERHPESSAAVSRKLIWTDNTAITVNRKRLQHTGSTYCSCSQHAVFHHLLILSGFWFYLGLICHIPGISSVHCTVYVWMENTFFIFVVSTNWTMKGWDWVLHQQWKTISCESL